MMKDFDLKNELAKILPILLKKIQKEIKLEISDNEQIKRIQAYTKLLEQINKMFKLIEPPEASSGEFLEQHNRILESYLKFNTEKHAE